MSSDETNEVNEPTETNTSPGIDTGSCLISFCYFSI